MQKQNYNYQRWYSYQIFIKQQNGKFTCHILHEVLLSTPSVSIHEAVLKSVQYYSTTIVYRQRRYGQLHNMSIAKVFSSNGVSICFRFVACLSILLYKTFKTWKVIANLLLPWKMFSMGRNSLHVGGEMLSG